MREIDYPQVYYTVVIACGSFGQEKSILQCEGEPPMLPHQKDVVSELLGDGNCQVSVSRDMSSKYYGTGGSVHISVKVTCNQDAMTIYNAGQFAHELTQNMLDKFYPEMLKHLESHRLSPDTAQ